MKPETNRLRKRNIAHMLRGTQPKQELCMNLKHGRMVVLLSAYDVSPQKDLTKALEGLKGLKFGITRGFAVAKEFDNAAFLRKEEVPSDELDLKKLESKRIDLVVIDKFTAADLMVKKYPQMI